MKCPVCMEVQLVMTDRQGIEIDYCPQCRGVWLDRGELDKIIDRASPQSQPQSQPQSVPGAHVWQPPAPGRVPDERGYRDEHRQRDDHRHHDDDDDYPRRRKKRGGILGELFDFD